jgi:hypothetical protein
MLYDEVFDDEPQVDAPKTSDNEVTYTKEADSEVIISNVSIYLYKLLVHKILCINYIISY